MIMNNIPMNKMNTTLPIPNRVGGANSIPQGNKTITGTPFHEILKEKQAATELKFSKHANERLASRNIDLTDEQFKRLESGTKKAYEKGIKESLVMVDDLAFIVNIKNNTVITAVNEGDEKVFTNIDGAVII